MRWRRMCSTIMTTGLLLPSAVYGRTAAATAAGTASAPPLPGGDGSPAAAGPGLTSRDASAPAATQVRPTEAALKSLGSVTDFWVFHGYGELQLNDYDYPDNIYRDRTTTPQRDQRATFDLNKISVTGIRPITKDISGEFELVLLHTGIVGTSTPNFGGPFNEEHPGGTTQGAVLLNKAFVAKAFSPTVRVSVGRVPVAVGMLALVDTPDDYLGAKPFEGELAMLPEDWTDMGVSLRWQFGPFLSTTQLVAGLDSTGFNSYSFVAGGAQGRFGWETTTEPAFVQRLDWFAAHNLDLGLTYYFGETSQNRPTPDMLMNCQKQTNNIAPCGFIHAPVTLADFHLTYKSDRLTTNILALWGSVRHANDINAKNVANTTNLPGVYSPVGAKAYTLSFEAGVYAGAPAPGERLTPYIRFERYNTMFEAAKTADENPQFDRTVLTAGVDWRMRGGIYAKLDYGRRHFASTKLGYESTATLSSGWIY